MKRIAIASPYSGDVMRNTRYLRACLGYVLGVGHAPYASHGLYTQPGVLNDDDPAQRAKGILAGHVWINASDALWVFVDLGLSRGMRDDINAALTAGVPVETHRVPGWTP